MFLSAFFFAFDLLAQRDALLQRIKAILPIKGTTGFLHLGKKEASISLPLQARIDADLVDAELDALIEMHFPPQAKPDEPLLPEQAICQSIVFVEELSKISQEEGTIMPVVIPWLS